MPKAFWIYIACVNTLAFFVTAIDKWLAKHHKRRVRERTLLLLAFIGGAGGTFLAMNLCRHKTKKPLFYITVPLVLLLWVAVIILLHK